MVSISFRLQSSTNPTFQNAAPSEEEALEDVIQALRDMKKLSDKIITSELWRAAFKVGHTFIATLLC